MDPSPTPLWLEDEDLLPTWLDAPSRAALRAADPAAPVALIAAGRLLRGGHLPGGARAKLEERLANLPLVEGDHRLQQQIDTLLSEIEEGLAKAEREPAADGVSPLLGARDDLESLSWALGIAGVEGSERRLLKRTTELDRRALTGRDHLAAGLALSPAPPTWLSALSEMSPGAWWSNLVVASDHRERIGRWLTRPLVGSSLVGLQLSLAVIDRAAAMHFGGEAESEPEAILERPLGAPVATLFDGEVLIHTHGLAEHDREVAPGLVVRHARGAFDRIREVGLEPEGAILPHRSPLALAWWVPLAGIASNPERVGEPWTHPRSLRVRLARDARAEEEAVEALELNFERKPG